VEKRDTYSKKVLIYDTLLTYTYFMLKINFKVKVQIFTEIRNLNEGML